VTGPITRRRASGTVPELVTRRVLGGEAFVLLIEATVPDLDLAGWLAGCLSAVRAELTRYAAIMFRGFAVDSAADFSRAARTVSPELLGYLERAAARTEVADRVFTSTEFAADQWIPLHHEMSYSHNWPSLLYFYCALPSTEGGGATPLTSERLVTPRIPAEIRDRFLRDGVRYVRNYRPELDLPWQEAFQTGDRREVEAYCDATATEYQWVGQDGLRTVARRQAMATHPGTGERLWFNHAHLFHQSNMPTEVRAALLREYGTDGLPRNAYYGDGTAIEDEVIQAIGGLYRDHAVSVPWHTGDVLVVDNFLATHGREPFAGDRRILVAMSDLYTDRSL